SASSRARQGRLWSFDSLGSCVRRAANVSRTYGVTCCVSTVWLTCTRVRSHRIHELRKERTSIVRAWSCLRVVLHRVHRQLAMHESFDRPIVQIDVRHHEL